VKPNHIGQAGTTPARTLRERDAGTLRRSLDEARTAVENLHTAWGVWADDVRQDAERRHGPDAPEQTLWADPEYSLALDGGLPTYAAKEAVQQATAWFARARGRPAASRGSRTGGRAMSIPDLLPTRADLDAATAKTAAALADPAASPADREHAAAMEQNVHILYLQRPGADAQLQAEAEMEAGT
jgi:hypothetical protein